MDLKELLMVEGLGIKLKPTLPVFTTPHSKEITLSF
jgi:hypothetical protein